MNQHSINALVIIGLEQAKKKYDAVDLNIVTTTSSNGCVAGMPALHAYTEAVKNEVEAGLLPHIAELERRLKEWQDKTAWLGKGNWLDPIHRHDVASSHTADLLAAVVYHQRDTINSLEAKCNYLTCDTKAWDDIIKRIQSIIPPVSNWTLPPPPIGRVWHKNDWTEARLKGGYRPLLVGEVPCNGDQRSYPANDIDDGGVWTTITEGRGCCPIASHHWHHRTKRPLPTTPMTIQTKLGVGQEAWFLHENKATTRPVGNINTEHTDIADLSRTTQSIVSTTITYGFRMYKDHPKTHGEMTWLNLPEHQVFATKEEFIASL